MASTTKFCCDGAFDWLLQQFTNQALLAFIQEDGKRRKVMMYGGFQLSVNTVRSKNMLQRLHYGDIPMQLLKKLTVVSGVWQPLHEVLKAVDTQWLMGHWRLLLEKYDCPHELVIAFIKSENETVRRLGMRLLKVPSLWADNFQLVHAEEKSFFKTQLWQAFSCLFAENLKKSKREEPASEAVASTSESAPALPQKMQDRLQQEQSRRREVKRELDELKKSSQENERKLKERISELTGELKRTRESIEQRLAERDRMHQREMEQFLEQHFGNHETLVQETERRQQNTDMLLLKVEQVIVEQQHLDQQHGLKTRLREQEKKLTDALARLQMITRESNVVHPAIRKLLPEVERQIAELRNALDDKTEEVPLSGMATQLYAALLNVNVNRQETEQELESLGKFVESATEHELLQPSEKDYLLEIVRQQKNRHLDIRQLKSRHFLPKSAEAEEILHREKQTILVMAQFFAILPTVHLIVDACNVVQKDRSYWRSIMERNGERTGYAEASHAFIEHCRRKKIFFKSLTLVFDSKEATLSTVEADGNFNVVYARKIQEEHNADLAIIDKINELRQNDADGRIWMVTDDVGLKQAVVEECDAYVVPETLTRFVLA